MFAIIGSRRRLRRSSLARLACAATAASVVFGAFSGGVAHAVPADPLPGFWMPNGNDSLLLNAEQVGLVTRASGLGVDAVSSQFADSSQRVSPAACVGLYQPGEADAYSNATNATTVVIDDGHGGSATRVVQQSVIGNADAASARRQFSRAAGTWSQCSGQSLAVKSRTGRTIPWTVGLPTPTTDSAVRVVTNVGPGAVCERALTVRDAIVVDVMACVIGGGDAAGQAEAIAVAVSDNVAKRDG